MEPKAFRDIFKRKRINTYLLCIFVILTVMQIFNLFVYREPRILIETALFLGLSVLTFVRRKKFDPSEDVRPDQAYINKLHDSYTRGALNVLLIGSIVLASLIYTGIQINMNNSKPAELFEYIGMHLIWAELFALFLAKDLILRRWTERWSELKNTKLFRKYFVICLIITVLYWSIVLVAFHVLNTDSVFTFAVAAALFVCLILFFDLKYRKKLLEKNFVFNKKVAIVAAVLILVFVGYSVLSRDVWLTQPYINTIPNIYEGRSQISYDDSTGVYTITKNRDDFRILQLTDIHLGGSISSYNNDMKALQACYDLISYTKPDLVVVTGDLTYPVGLSSFSLNNSAPVMQFAAFMRNMGVPWAFTYGNHDTEAMAATNEHSLNEIYKSLSYKTSKTLLYPYVQPEIMGRNNQLIEIREQDGSLCYGLFLIDSNAYVGKGFSDYDCIRDDQVEWYRQNVLKLEAEAGHTVPSLCFFHISLQEYRTAYELYESGSNEVKYYFGELGEGYVCCSEYPSKLFDTAYELGSTKGFFCGHDHYNNISLEYKGMRLTYGMSIDYLVYPGIARETKQRGATVIDLGKDGSMSIEQVPYDSIPKASQQ